MLRVKMEIKGKSYMCKLKTIPKTVNTKTILNEMLYIVKKFFMDIFSFLGVFNWEKINTGIIINTLLLNSKEPQLYPYSIHQLQMRNNTVKYEVTNLLYLWFPNNERFFYMIPQHMTIHNHVFHPINYCNALSKGKRNTINCMLFCIIVDSCLVLT